MTFNGLEYVAFPKTTALNFAPSVSFSVALYVRASLFASGSVIAADKGAGESSCGLHPTSAASLPRLAPCRREVSYRLPHPPS